MIGDTKLAESFVIHKKAALHSITSLIQSYTKAINNIEDRHIAGTAFDHDKIMMKDYFEKRQKLHDILVLFY